MAYYQSVKNPYQGLFVGEPLSAPFAVLGAGDWLVPSNGAVLSGVANLGIEFEAAGAEHPVGRFDLYVDGRFHQTITNLPPASRNTLQVTVRNISVSYQIPPAATVSSTAVGLADALNQKQMLSGVQAKAVGDRILLSGLDFARTGSAIPLSASSSAGSATSLTTWVRAARGTFLDSPAQGTVTASVSNAPALGDWLQLVVVKTNGSVAALGVTNSSGGETALSMAQSLTNLIQSSPELQLSDGIVVGDFYSPDKYAAYFDLRARTSGWPAAQIQVSLRGSSGLRLSPGTAQKLEENQSDLAPRNHLYVSSGLPLLTFSFPFDSTQVDDGYHELTAVAVEGDSVSTQTRFSRQVRVQNTSLSATITPGVSGVATTDMTWKIGVGANRPGISKIELFSTGGRIGVAADVTAAEFTVPSAMLGVGEHPFYARVTDLLGNSYRTETTHVRLISPFALKLNPQATLLSWTATPGLRYQVMQALSLAEPFQVIASFIATNSVARFPLPLETSTQAFYRVQVLPD